MNAKKNDDLKCTTDQPNLSKYSIVTRCEKSKYQTSTSKENLLVWQNHSSEAEKVKVSKTTNEWDFKKLMLGLNAKCSINML